MLLPLTGFADAAGFKADDFPLSLRVADEDAGVAIAAGEIDAGVCAAGIGTGGQQGRGSVEADAAVGDFNGFEMGCAAAQADQPLLLGLQGAVGGNGHVVVGQQGFHGGGIRLEQRGAPLLFQLIYLVASFMLLRPGQCGMRLLGNEWQRKRGYGKKRDEEERSAAAK